MVFVGKEELFGDFSNIICEGFICVLEISFYFLIDLSLKVKELMIEGGSILILSYLGGVWVVCNYNVMGIVKFVLEMNVCYLVVEFGFKNIRINVIFVGLIRILVFFVVGGILDMIYYVEKVVLLCCMVI